MTRGIQALVWILVLSMVLVGCISKSGDESVIQPSESKNKVGIEKAKKLVLESEEWLKRIKEHGNGERIGDFGVSPIYGLEDPSRDNLETKLLKYFSKDIHKYVLATHEIFCTAELCGVYGDSEGQYQVDVDGNFSIKEQTEAYIDLNVPFIYEGLPSDYQDLSPSYGVYRVSNNQGELLIVMISQEYNDQLYNYEDDLLVESVLDDELNTQVNSPIIEKAGDAEQCMVSLIAARDDYTYEDKGDVTNLVMHSILSSQLYLNRKYGTLFDTDHNTVTDLANDPMPIFLDDKADMKLIYPGLSYQDKVISIDMSEGGFQKMVADWSEAIKPWEVDASQLKGLAGCSVLPFKDIKFSSKGGATRIMKPDDEKSNIYDYINTLNMWSDDALAAQKYAERIGKGNSATDEGAPNQQFVYLYCPSCEIESLVLQNMKEEKRSVMEIKFDEVEGSEGWHIFKAEAEESLWLDSSPFLLDDISGYSQFSLHANDQSYVFTNQVVPAATDSSDGIDDIVGSYYSGQTLLTINSFEDGILSGSLSAASHNFSKIAEVEFTGEVKNDQIQFDFEGDGYGTEGASKGVLSLNKDNFIVDLQLVQNNLGWSLPEGKTSFSRSLRTYNMAMNFNYKQ